MKRWMLVGALVFIVVALTGCGTNQSSQSSTTNTSRLVRGTDGTCSDAFLVNYEYTLNAYERAINTPYPTRQIFLDAKDVVEVFKSSNSGVICMAHALDPNNMMGPVVTVNSDQEMNTLLSVLNDYLIRYPY